MKIKYLAVLLLLISIFMGCNDKKEESESQKINRLSNAR
jgi:hypothetical protein